MQLVATAAGLKGHVLLHSFRPWLRVQCIHVAAVCMCAGSAMSWVNTFYRVVHTHKPREFDLVTLFGEGLAVSHPPGG